MSGWAWFWLLWVLVGVVVELVAVARKAEGDTLSDAWGAVKVRFGAWDWVWSGATLVGLVWLAGHWVGGWW